GKDLLEQFTPQAALPRPQPAAAPRVPEDKTGDHQRLVVLLKVVRQDVMLQPTCEVSNLPIHARLDTCAERRFESISDEEQRVDPIDHPQGRRVRFPTIAATRYGTLDPAIEELCQPPCVTPVVREPICPRQGDGVIEVVKVVRPEVAHVPA